MRKTILCAPLIASVLAGCNETGGGVNVTPIANTTIAQIQSVVAIACGVEPGAAMVAELLRGTNASVQAGIAIANGLEKIMCPSKAAGARFARRSDTGSSGGLIDYGIHTINGVTVVVQGVRV